MDWEVEPVVLLDGINEQDVTVAMFPLLKFVEVHRFNQFAKLYALGIVLQVGLRVPSFGVEVFDSHGTPLQSSKRVKYVTNDGAEERAGENGEDDDVRCQYKNEYRQQCDEP